MSDPHRMKFRRSSQEKSILARDERDRQGRVVNAARSAFASTDAVKAFLNTHHAALCGRPLDLAVASNAGLLAVEAAIHSESGVAPR